MRTRALLLLVLLWPRPLAAQPIDLTVPSWLFVTAATADWATSSSACLVTCAQRTPLLPTVSDAKVAVPLGLPLDAFALWSVHKWIAPRWPKAAEVVLYGLTILRFVDAYDHINQTRRSVRTTQ